MIIPSFLGSSARRAFLGSCLAISLVTAVIPSRAANPPKFKNPEVNATVRKLSDLIDAIDTATKAKDETKAKELGAKIGAMLEGNPAVFTEEGGLQPGKATPDERATFEKWFLAEANRVRGDASKKEAVATKSLAQARQLALACKLYAGDNEGAFPPNLDALVPAYIDAAALKKLLVSPLAPDEPVGYTYHPGLEDTSPPATILIEDKFAPKVNGRKIVARVDGSAEITK